MKYIVYIWIVAENQTGGWAMLGYPQMLSRLSQFQTMIFWVDTRSSYLRILILGDRLIPMVFYV